MMRWLAPLITGLMAALIGFWLVLNWVPGFIMDKAMARVETAAGINTVWHGPPTSEASRNVVRPSPDIIYSICAFDLSEGPVVLHVPWPEDGSYASVSFYDANTNNFAVINDQDVEGEANSQIHLNRLAITPPGGISPVAWSRSQIVSPTPTGLALYRRVVMGGTSIEDADTGRRAFSCEATG